MFDVDDTAPDTPAPRELSQDVQALINNGLDFLDKAREELEASKPKFSGRTNTGRWSAARKSQ